MQNTEGTNNIREPRVGDTVRFRWVFDELTGTVIEDRGTIGVGGRRLLTVTAPMDAVNSVTLELPSESLQVINRQVQHLRKKRPPRRLKVTPRTVSH